MPADQPPDVTQLLADLADAYSMTIEEATAAMTKGVSERGIRPYVASGPPCLRCGGDIADHILTAGPNGGDDEYRCLVDELSDVIGDLETCDPPAEPGWVEVLRHVEAAYKRSLVVHEGPVVVGSQFQAPPGTEADHMAVVNDGFVPPFQVDRGPIARSAWDAEHDAADQTPESAWVQDAAESIEAAGVFAVLRDIADAEPVAPIIHPTDRLPDVGQLIESILKYALRCTMCKAVGASTAPTAREPFPPVEHLISCPWARAVEIVGVKTDG